MDLPTVSSFRRARERDDLVLAPGETVVSGGTWLFSTPQPATTGLVDLTTLGWTPWEATDAGVRIAATCTVEELLAVPAEVLGSAHELARSCADAFLMSFKVQHLATVGGNVCLALPAGAMISLLVGLDAKAVVWSADGSTREQPVSELVTGVQDTTLAPGEVLRAIEVPRASLADRYAFRRTSLAPLGRSSVVVVARRTPSVGPGQVVVSITAATSRPVVLEVDPSDPSALQRALDDVDCWYADPHGAADWREAMTRRLAAECMAEVTA
jgi:CO/xanthine dehydrogenase FAD-binding subunit